MKREPEELLLASLPLIERLAEFQCRKTRFSRQDREDFVSAVKLKLLADDYAVLRRHRGDSSFDTYLTTVVVNCFRDFRNRKLGKFRPSAAAKRLGPDAVLLERYLVRDRSDLETAIRQLRTRHRVERSADELRDLAAALPPRTRRSFVGEEVLESRGVEPDAERRLEERERAATAKRVEKVLNLALQTLAAEDLLILKMHFGDGCTIAAIAAALGLDQRRLYTRRDRCFRQLKSALESAGLAWDRVEETLGWEAVEIRADFGGGGNSADRSVQQSGGPLGGGSA